MKKPLFEQILVEEVTEQTSYEIWDVDRMSDYVYDGGSKLNKRFRPYIKGGAFKFFYPEYDLTRRKVEDILFFVGLVGGIVVGISKIEKNPYVENQWWVSYVTVDKKYQGQGHASKIIEIVVKWFTDNNIVMEGSTYTNDGLKKLQAVIRRLVEKYEVKYLEINPKD